MAVRTSNRNAAELVRRALDALGGNATDQEIREYVKASLGGDLQGKYGTGFSMIRKRWAEDQAKHQPVSRITMPSDNGEKEPLQRRLTEITLAAHSPVMAVKLARQAIEAAGGKDALRELLDLL